MARVSSADIQAFKRDLLNLTEDFKRTSDKIYGFSDSEFNREMGEYTDQLIQFISEIIILAAEVRELSRCNRDSRVTPLRLVRIQDE